ncbi:MULTISPECIES: hypothetical protein [unclassified Hydrogenophaga]|uniref:hypothetical protein n=1 Tax=unclassified Hydrogenophaga TaxID=2610897 RepID=UPI00131F9872|nr:MULTISPECIES: hypothetical protein [unclassified Hydrogenophaga]QHE78705.1 hypothetical protein F9Z45_21480 [Hydrogenophaga sp. PBL-H3]QHE83130.1 hypothetical protein F9Z44_21480 [Hydrogenophaga sp. PBL-H3]
MASEHTQVKTITTSYGAVVELHLIAGDVYSFNESNGVVIDRGYGPRVHLQTDALGTQPKMGDFLSLIYSLHRDGSTLVLCAVNASNGLVGFDRESAIATLQHGATVEHSRVAIGYTGAGLLTGLLGVMLTGLAAALHPPAALPLAICMGLTCAASLTWGWIKRKRDVQDAARDELLPLVRSMIARACPRPHVAPYGATCAGNSPSHA